MSDLIDRRKALDGLEYEMKYGAEIDRCGLDTAYDIIENMPSAEPERKRKFLKIVVKYPEVCTYPEFKGKPYYSIMYEENGETIVGFGTYKPEVLSQYLKDYFILSTESERKKGKWKENHTICSECGWQMIDDILQSPNMVFFNFCPNCGADMRGTDED